MAQALAYEKAVLEVRAMAQKQLEIDLSVVTPLVDSNWADFLQQIKTCVGTCGSPLQGRTRHRYRYPSPRACCP